MEQNFPEHRCECDDGDHKFVVEWLEAFPDVRNREALIESLEKASQLDRWMAALPQATVVRLDGAGHWPHEEEPEAVLRALERFLAEATRPQIG